MPNTTNIDRIEPYSANGQKKLSSKRTIAKLFTLRASRRGPWETGMPGLSKTLFSKDPVCPKKLPPKNISSQAPFIEKPFPPKPMTRLAFLENFPDCAFWWDSPIGVFGGFSRLDFFSRIFQIGKNYRIFLVIREDYPDWGAIPIGVF